MKYTRFGLAVAALGLGSLGLLATTSPSTAEDLSYFEKGYAPFASLPVFVAPGPSFDAPGCMKNKSILSIPVSSANPFTANIEKSMQGVAAKVGFKFTTWENQGQSSQWVQGSISIAAAPSASGRVAPGPCRARRRTAPGGPS